MKRFRINQKLLFEIIICLTLLCIGLYFALTNKPTVSEKHVYNELILKDRLTFELNSEVNLYDLIDKKNEVEILSENTPIDTSSLGEKKLTIKYLDVVSEVLKDVVINIVDTTPPQMTCDGVITTVVGRQVDLLSHVKVSDNSLENIEVNVVGDYSFDKVGTYELSYVAEDSNKNKTTLNFKLIVNRLTTTTRRITYTTTTTTARTNVSAEQPTIPPEDIIVSTENNDDNNNNE